MPAFRASAAWPGRGDSCRPRGAGQRGGWELAAAADEGALKRGALLAESAQRLLWLYHEHLPALVAETRFDVGKLLVGVQEGVEGAGPHPGLVALRQLHVLRLLKESEDFSWSGKSGKPPCMISWNTC